MILLARIDIERVDSGLIYLHQVARWAAGAPGAPGALEPAEVISRMILVSWRSSSKRTWS